MIPLLILLTGCALLFITSSAVQTPFNLGGDHWLFSGTAIAIILITYAISNVVNALKALQVINFVALISILYLLFYHMGYDVLNTGISITSINEQIALIILTLCFWLLNYVIAQILTSHQQPHLSTNTLIQKSLLQPSVIFSLLSGAVLTLLLLTVLKQLGQSSALFSYLEIKFLQRGLIPPLTLLLFFWGLLLLIGKGINLLRYAFTPNHSTLAQAAQKSGNRAHFWTLVNDTAEQFYDIPRYINYAIPILGFIGTVLGISLSAEGIADIIASPLGLSSANNDLSKAISPLGIAFDTTLIALSLGLILTLIQTIIARIETSLLNRLYSSHHDS